MVEDTAGWTPGQDVAHLLRAPEGPEPSNSSARLTDGFAAVEAEVKKLDSPTGQPVAWSSVVVGESETYLQQTAKDLRIATYLALAWVQGGKPKGLRRGLDLLVGLLDGHWEALYPPVEKLPSRIGALTWFTEHGGPHVKAALDQKQADDEAKALVESFAQYQAVVARRFPDRGPSLAPFIEAFEAAQAAGRLPAPPKPAAAEAKDGAVKAEGGADGGAPEDPMLTPIAGAEDPAGTDPKLTDEFDQLYVEIQKVEQIDFHPEWPMVRDMAAKLLETKSKDLRCLIYWSYARLRLDGVKGLAEGLATTAACCERFENLHPLRPKAKSGALGWLGTRLEEDLPNLVKSAPEADVKSLHASLDAMQKSLGGRAKSLDGLQRARGGVMSIKVEKPKPVAPAKPAAAAKPTASAAAPAAPKPAVPAAPVVPAELEGVSAEMLDHAQQLAASGETLHSLRLRRQALWLAEPALIKGKKYDCQSLGMKERLEVESIFNAKKWDELLERTEELFPGYPFCLDLTFWAAKAAGTLIGLEVTKALAGELVALSIRSPRLSRGTDRDGQALASGPTRAWITEFKGAPGGTSASATTGETPAAAAPGGSGAIVMAATPEALPEDIEKLFKDGKLNEAVAQASASAVGLRGRAAFQLNLLLAERLQTAKAGPFAFSLFRALLGQLRTASLAQWEPTVGARCIRGYLHCARLSKTKIEDERELLDELMILDPGAAIGLV